MIAAGEDPRFIARRLIISASEDVGNADPRALQVAVAAAQALDHVGLPEAQYALAQATTYIATAPEVEPVGARLLRGGRRRRGRGSLPVPLHLRQRRRPPDEARTGSASAIATRRSSRAPTSTSSTCPTSSSTAATTSDRPGLRVDDRRPPGRPRRGAGRREGGRQDAAQPEPDARRPRKSGDLMRTRETNRKKLAETEKRDADAG